jgi:hypothetical protein
MFNDILVALFTSYKISISPTEFTRIKMDKDEEEKMQKYWSEYLQNEYSSEDFFVDTPEELLEKQQAFANPICLDCSKETYSLIKDEKNDILSKCPCCKRTYKTHI